MQIHLLVFEALPEPLDKHIVAPAPGSVHADLDAVLFQQARKLQARGLVALIGTEDRRGAIGGHGLLDCFSKEIGRQRIGQAPRQHPATGPVYDNTQVHEAAVHRTVGDISRPDMVRPGDRHIV